MKTLDEKVEELILIQEGSTTAATSSSTATLVEDALINKVSVVCTFFSSREAIAIIIFIRRTQWSLALHTINNLGHSGNAGGSLMAHS